MPVSGLVAATDFTPEGRYRPRERRPTNERPAKAEDQTPPAAPELKLDAAYQAGRFKTDLTQLQPFDGARETATPPGGENDQQLFDFFGNLSVLLLAVRAGDIVRAQSAADALEMELLIERSAGRRPGASAQMLEGLGALLSAAQSQDERAARFAAKELAADFEGAAGPPLPAAEPDDGGAAYDTLAHYLDGDEG